MKELLMAGIGGFIGSGARYALGSLLVGRGSFPLATFIVNTSGCFLIGVFFELSQRFGWSDTTRVFLMAGLCGGFTTFSSLAIENLKLLQDKDYFTFALYSAGSFGVGLAAVLLGIIAARA